MYLSYKAYEYSKFSIVDVLLDFCGVVMCVDISCETCYLFSLSCYIKFNIYCLLTFL